MIKILLEVMREIGNFFVNPNQIERGSFKIENGIVQLNEKYLVGQYIAVTGSILHDDIYLLSDVLYTLENAKDEEFEGIVYGLSVPKDFLTLVEQIDEFQSNPQNRPSANVSESFGIDSRSRAVGKSGAVLTWQGVFSSQLWKYRKMFAEINI